MTRRKQSDAERLRRLDRKIGSGRATRAEAVEAIDLRRKRAAAKTAGGVMGGASLNPRARFMPQGTCPKPWVAELDGEPLRDRRGGARRYASREAAERAAKAAEAVVHEQNFPAREAL